MIRSSELCEEFDPFKDAPPDVHYGDEWLIDQGWNYWFRIGRGIFSNQITPWYRELKDGGTSKREWMIEIEDALDATFYLRVPDLPTVLDLLARWGPIPVVERLAEFLSDFSDPDVMDGDNLLENIVGRAAWAAGHLPDDLDRSFRQRRNERAKRDMERQRRAEEKKATEATQE